MATIALTLQDSAARRMRALWAMLEERFGLSGVHQVPFPHLTLMAFEHLTHPQIKPLLERIAQNTAPFKLEALGLGLFTHPATILYAPVVLTPRLHHLHRVLYQEVKQLGGEIPRIQSPDGWVPHLTLAQGNPTQGSYGQAVDLLLREELHLPFEARNLTLFDWIGPRYEPCDRFPLMGRAAKQAGG